MASDTIVQHNLFQVIYRIPEPGKDVRRDVHVAALNMEDAIKLVRTEFNYPHIITIRDTGTVVYHEKPKIEIVYLPDTQGHR